MIVDVIFIQLYDRSHQYNLSEHNNIAHSALKLKNIKIMIGWFTVKKKSTIKKWFCAASNNSSF